MFGIDNKTKVKRKSNKKILEERIQALEEENALNDQKIKCLASFVSALYNNKEFNWNEKIVDTIISILEDIYNGKPYDNKKIQALKQYKFDADRGLKSLSMEKVVDNKTYIVGAKR